jgi:hypothetical protein
MNVQPTIISAATIIDAWRACAELLISKGAHLNLLVHISKPSAIDVDELSLLDPKNVDASATSLFDVANTIFPSQGPKWTLPAKDFSDYYIPVYRRLGRSVPYSWGFYFQRLVEFGPNKINQLTRIVDGLNAWGRNHHAAFVAHLSSSDLDKPRPQGAPCLQYVQFMRGEEDQLTMTAVYRSHDYFLKALGNFVGLSRILAYICKETGLSIGPLSCLSTYAFLGNNRGKTRQLLTGR